MYQIERGMGHKINLTKKISKLPKKKFFFWGGEKFFAIIFVFFASFEMIPSNSKFINGKFC